MFRRPTPLARHRELLAAASELEEQLTRFDYVVGVGVGYVGSDASASSQIPGLVVYTRDQQSVHRTQKLLAVRRAGRQFAVEVQKAQTVSQRAARVRPLHGGLQIQEKGHELTGTLGCFAADDDDDGLVLLSNAHILTARGQEVMQPDASCCCNCKEKIGTTRRRALNEKVDAAIAYVRKKAKIRPGRNRVAGSEVAGTIGVADLPLGTPVQKYGARTSRTVGTIGSVNASVLVLETGILMKQQLGVIPDSGEFLENGDSGAVLMTEDFRVAGLLHTSSGTEPFPAFASPIRFVEEELRVTIATGNLAGLKRKPLSAPVGDIAEEEEEEDELDRAALALQRRYRNDRALRRLLGTAASHRSEVLTLVNQDRVVGRTWKRAGGPEILKRHLSLIKTPRRRVKRPDRDSIRELLLRMAGVLVERGSPGLREAVLRETQRVLEAVEQPSLDRALHAMSAYDRTIVPPLHPPRTL